MTHCFEDRRRFHLAVTAFTCFRFDAPEDLLTEAEMWDFVKAELKGKVFDMAMPKLAGEVLVHGHAFAPGGVAVRRMEVGLALGGVRKRLVVHGDRSWQLAGRLIGRLSITEPEPFVSLPLDWPGAFGGTGFARNPLGKGWLPPKGDVHGLALPNVEPSGAEMSSPSHVPEPAGFGPLDLGWPQRNPGGTYDEEWLAAHSPGLPPDADWRCFNAAPSDQRIAGFFNVGEDFALAGMHPQRPLIEGRLPRLRPRAFLDQGIAGRQAFVEVPLVAETVWLFPHALTGIVVWRGVTAVAEDDGADVRALLLAYERAESPPRLRSHYGEALAGRLRRDAESVALLSDFSDIAPPQHDPSVAEAAAEMQRKASDLAQRIRKRVGQVPAPSDMAPTKAFEAYDAALARARATLAKLGKKPADFLPANLVVMSARGFPMLNPAHRQRFAGLMPTGVLGEDGAMEAFIERWDAHADAQVAEAQRQMGETGRYAGVNLDAALSELERQPGEAAIKAQSDLRGHLGAMANEVPGMAGVAGPIAAFKDGADGYVREAEALEKLEARLKILERKVQDTAQEQVLGGPVQDLKALRNEVLAQREAVRQAFERFTYLGEPAQALKDASSQAAILRKKAEDMARATLPWAEIQALRAAPDRVVRGRQEVENALAAATYLDRETLTGCDLRGLDMADRKLAGMALHLVDLQGASLVGASLARTIVTAGRIANADLSGVSLKGAVLDKVIATAARIRGADALEARFVDCDLDGADFTGTRLEAAQFVRCRLRGARFSGRLEQVAFQHCDLRRAVFASCHLERTLFAECDVAGADFTAITGAKVLFARCRGDGADFTNAQVDGLRLLGGSRFVGAHFDAAGLPRAGMVEARLEDARFDGAVLDGAALVGATLTGASLRGISAHRTSFRGAELAAADLEGARMIEANLGKAKLVGARLDGACLFAAETLRVKVDKARFGGTMLLRTRLGMGLP
jgi:uncharacterized protein YjbI with pentapeptide repeats